MICTSELTNANLLSHSGLGLIFQPFHWHAAVFIQVLIYSTSYKLKRVKVWSVVGWKISKELLEVVFVILLLFLFFNQLSTDVYFRGFSLAKDLCH